MLKEWFDYVLGRLQVLLARLSGERVVHRRRQYRGRRFAARKRRRKMAIQRWTLLACIALCIVMFLVGAVKLVGYGLEYLSSALASRQLRQTYYETLTAAPVLTPTPSATPAPAATATPAATDAPLATEKPPTLRPQPYPDNPWRIINSRFTNIRKQNSDIVGWLTIDGMIDEPVVQRDNIFYMTHDYQKRSNANGAIFLDEIVSLNSRPYTLILYGHNMRSGAVFGNLRDYEKLSFYKANPFITFDSIYEDGRYVIFSVTQVSVNNKHSIYLDVGGLVFGNVGKRNEVLSMLSASSVIRSSITVRADDQVLLLVTCTGDNSERRVIAARRLREGETEADVLSLVQQSYKQ